jgi:predicted Fe-Mo cluster-binding NifX family protein
MQLKFTDFPDFHRPKAMASGALKIHGNQGYETRGMSMKIAIPVFQTKISPRFDSAQSILLLRIQNDSIVTREELPMTGWSVSAKRKELVKRDVDTMICGGIDYESMQYLVSGGINVYSWITGEIEDAVTRFIDKGLESGIILGTRGRREGQWRFCTRKDHFCHAEQTAFKPAGEGVNVMPKGKGSSPSGKDTGAGRGGRCGKVSGGPGQGKGRGTGAGKGARCSRTGSGSGRSKGGGTGQSRNQGNGKGGAREDGK